MIVIIGSRKFSREIKNLCNYLNKNGLKCECPPFFDFESSEEIINEWACNGLVYDHLFKINRAQLGILYNPEGYIGINTAMEVGYLVQRNITLISLFNSKEYCINLFVNEVINSDEEQVILEKVNEYFKYYENR